METASATLRRLRMAPRKVRLVVDLVRGRRLNDALSQLRVSPKSAARPVRKLIESAAANAVNNHHLHREALFVQTITVDDGPTIKRFTPRAFGRATTIRKRMSHVMVTLAEDPKSIPETPISKASSTKRKTSVAKRSSKVSTASVEKNDKEVVNATPASQKVSKKQPVKKAVKKTPKKSSTTSTT